MDHDESLCGGCVTDGLDITLIPGVTIHRWNSMEPDDKIKAIKHGITMSNNGVHIYENGKLIATCDLTNSTIHYADGTIRTCAARPSGVTCFDIGALIVLFTPKMKRVVVTHGGDRIKIMPLDKLAQTTASNSASSVDIIVKIPMPHIDPKPCTDAKPDPDMKVPKLIETTPSLKRTASDLLGDINDPPTSVIKRAKSAKK